MIIFYFFISIILINLIIFFHELGHFLFGILFKEKIKKFSIGFGKEIFGFTKNNIRYSFSCIPIGGFVKFSSRFYISNKNFNFLENGKKFLIILAGPLFNIIFALFLCIICINFFGIQNYDLNNNIIGNIQKNSLAEKNGLKINDKIIEINNKSISNWGDIIYKINEKTDFINKKILLKVERFENNEKKILNFNISFNENKLFLGISPKSYYKKVSFFDNIKFSCKRILLNFFSFFYRFKENTKISNFVGPIGISVYISDILENKDFYVLLNFLMILSLNLAFINLLPIPIFDGGRLLILLIEMIFRSRIHKKFLIILSNITIIFLFILMFYVLYKDLLKFRG